VRIQIFRLRARYRRPRVEFRRAGSGNSSLIVPQGRRLVEGSIRPGLAHAQQVSAAADVPPTALGSKATGVLRV